MGMGTKSVSIATGLENENWNPNLNPATESHSNLIGPPRFTASVRSNGSVILGGYYILASLSKPNAATDWSTSFSSILPSRSPASPASIGSDGSIYIGTRDPSQPSNQVGGGGIHSFEGSTGELQWSFTYAGWVESAPIITKDGLIIFGSLDGYLYAVQGSSTPDITAPWPTYGQNNRRNGRVESKDFTFSLTPPSSQNNNSLFNLESNGTLTTASTFDYETTPTLTIEVNATDYLGDSVIHTFTVQIQDVPSTSLVENDLLVKSENLYPNWYTSEWFGTFYVPTFPTNWIYHAELGWTFIYIVSDNSYWMYSKLKNNTEELGWLWTTDELFPYLYYNVQSRWLYYFKGLNQPTFFDYEDNDYIHAVE